jgi:hypothetical protein
MRNSPLQWSIPSMYNIDFEIWAFRNYTELTLASFAEQRQLDCYSIMFEKYHFSQFVLEIY